MCFDRLLAGIGLLSDHCRDLAFHGQKNAGVVGSAVYDCNAGHGPTVFRWRAFAMRGAGLDPDAFRLAEADAEVQRKRERDALILKAQSKIEETRKKVPDPRDA